MNTLTAQLTFIGRASVKIKYSDGFVVYVDPYAGNPSDYSDPADLILVTHQHGDHNQIQLVNRKDETLIIQCPFDITRGKTYRHAKFELYASAAYNTNHAIDQCCGFVIQRKAITVYHSGDTSNCEEMKLLKPYKIDYALLCMDGYYNMGISEAETVAATIDARIVIPIHTHKEDLYDPSTAERFEYASKRIVEPGQTIELT